MASQTDLSKFYKAVLLLPALVALAACGPTTAQQQAPERPVLVTTVHYEPQVADRSFVGTIRPRIESDLGFRVTGKVSKRLVEVGSHVDAGQPLATMDEGGLNIKARTT